jgi:uncharacterized glyoxalase superfamily protein PhnB
MNDDRTAVFQQAAPYFVVADVVATAEHYRDVLGFSFTRFFGDPPSFVIVTRGDVRLMLKQATTAADLRAPYDTRGLLDAYIWVDDVDALAGELRDRGADIVAEPEDQPIYDGRDMYVRDCDGHVLCFGQTS